MERIISCPVCYDEDLCFEDIQEEFKSYLCFHCGFMSDTRFTPKDKKFEEYISGSPRLVKELQFVDEKRKVVWFPSVVNMGSKGIIYPDGTIKKWAWKFAEVIDIPKKLQKKYEGYSQRLDVENATVYGQYEFLVACKDMGIATDIQQPGAVIKMPKLKKVKK